MAVSSNNQAPDVQDILAQMNAQTQHFGVDDALPGGVNPGSLATKQDEDNFYFYKADSSRQFGEPFTLSKGLSNFLPISRSATAPTTDDLPEDGNFGWHLDTVTGFYYWALNDAGTVVLQNIATFTGTITAAQHGDLSAETSDMHSFDSITGHISDAQHGTRGSAATHSAVVASGAAGFMIGTDKAKLDNYPADCTGSFIDPVSDSNAVQRSSGNICAKAYFVNNTRIITDSATGWGTPSGTLDRTFFVTGTVTLSELAQRVAALITDLRNHHGILTA